MKRRIELIEAARGAAAIYVMVGHLFWTTYELTGDGGPFFRLFRYGHEAVILFFLISGFSIHYTYADRPLTTYREVKRYYFARFRRIYPVFLVAFALTLLLSTAQRIILGSGMLVDHQGSTIDTVAQFFFLTDLRDSGTWFVVPTGNPALWSLSYEVAYYLVYPVFWRLSRTLSPRILIASVVAFSLAHEFLIVSGYSNHISKILGLYWIWCAGALVGQIVYYGIRPKCSSALYVGSLALALVAVGMLDNVPVRRLNDWLWAGVWGLLLFGYWATHTPSRIRLHLAALATIALVATILALLAPIPGSKWFLLLKLAAIFVFCLFLSQDINTRLRLFARLSLRPFFAAGSLSYALYAIHMPIILLISDFFARSGLSPLWSGISLPAIVWLAKLLEDGSRKALAAWLPERGPLINKRKNHETVKGLDATNKCSNSPSEALPQTDEM